MPKLIINESQSKSNDFHDVLTKHGFTKQRGGNSYGTHHAPYTNEHGDKITVQTIGKHVRALVPGKGPDDFYDHNKLDAHLGKYSNG